MMSNERKKPKRSANKTNKRPPRHDNPPAPRKAKHAWLSTNHKYPQRIRCLLRTQHHLPSAWTIREERSSPKHLEHDLSETTQNLPTNKTRKRTLKCNSKHAADDLHKNKSRNQSENPSYTTHNRIILQPEKYCRYQNWPEKIQQAAFSLTVQPSIVNLTFRGNG